jgi:hypothetical protein
VTQGKNCKASCILDEDEVLCKIKLKNGSAVVPKLKATDKDNESPPNQTPKNKDTAQPFQHKAAFG